MGEPATMLDAKDERTAWEVVARVARRTLVPAPLRNANAWAAAHRTLPPGSDRPGPWDPHLAPYVDEVANAFTDPDVSRVVLVAGAQMTKTELILCLLGQCLSDHPRPCMYVGPTQDQVRDIASDRFDKMVRHTKVLAEALDPRSTHQRVFERWINGAKISFAWAGSASQLASKPAALVLVDERDRMASDVGGEGDPVEVVAARTKTYYNAKVGIFSTPTIVGASPIWKWFEAGTRERWAWECPECRAWFVPCLELLRWAKDAIGPELRDSARVACRHCGIEIDDRARRELPGRYVPHAIDDAGNLTPVPERERLAVRSFQVSGLATPFSSLGQIAEALADAYRSKEVGRVQGAVNTWLGETYEVAGERPPWETVWAKRERYDQVDEVQLVTMGVDVQEDRLEWVVRGWGWMSESWLLGFGELHGFTRQRAVWAELTALRDRHYCGLPVELCAIDSGYLTDKVDNYVAAHLGGVIACRGVERLDPEIKKFKIKGALRHRWHFSTDYWKTWLYDHILMEPGEPGAWHVPMTVTQDYCQQVTNEELIVLSSGTRRWRPTGNRQNHKLDAEILATVAAHVMNVRSLRAPLVSGTHSAPDRDPPPPRGPVRVPREGARVPDHFQRRPL